MSRPAERAKKERPDSGGGRPGASCAAPLAAADRDAYDPALEEKEYSRALLSPADLAQLKREGFLTIEAVRELVRQNTVKESQEAQGETYAIDPEMLMLIDTRTNYRVFIAGDNVYTREELCAHYPFEELRTAPEKVFVQQEVGVFPPKTGATRGGLPGRESGAHEFVARDLGDNDEFIIIEDLVRRAAREGYQTERAPVRVVKTKVFLGKDRWKDFVAMDRLVRSFRTFVAPLMIASREGDAPASALTYLFGEHVLAGERARGALAVEDGAAPARPHEQRALEAKAQALQAKEEELCAREARLDRLLGLRGGAAGRDEEAPPAANGAA